MNDQKQFLKNSIHWNTQTLRELEDILETDIPIQDQSDFKTVREVKKEIKSTQSMIDKLKDQLQQLENPKGQLSINC